MVVKLGGPCVVTFVDVLTDTVGVADPFAIIVADGAAVGVTVADGDELVHPLITTTIAVINSNNNNAFVVFLVT
jgi:hypothetical protein